ncbi:MAG: hypothetical protein ACYDB4_19310 [Candidatus Dormibacteraceae bacterium]
MGHVWRHGKVAATLVLVGFAAACTVGPPATFTLNTASVDATYICPLGAADAPYNLNATLEVRNGTSSAVTIKSVAVVMTLIAVKGGWLERVGDKYEASGVSVSPHTVAPGSSTSVKVSVPSSCTNGKASSAGASYGEYSVAFTVATSAGTLTIGSENRHRIVAA